MQRRVDAPHPRSGTPSPLYLRFPILPPSSPRAPRLPYLLCTLRAPRCRRRHRVALGSECHVRRPAARARCGPARSRGAHRRGRGRASRCRLAPLFRVFFLEAFPSRGPASSNLSKILPERVTGATWVG